MFDFGPWLRSTKRRNARKIDLRLEALEDRSVPAGLFVAGVGGLTQARDPELSVYSTETGTFAGSPLSRMHAEAFSGTAGDTRVALGDVNGDGTDDLIAGSGKGGQAQVVVFDGASALRGTQAVLARFDPYVNFQGGVFVASADLNGDGKAEVVTTPGLGGRGHLKVFSFAGPGGGFSATPAAITSAYSFSDYNGEVRVATLRANGETFVVTASGAGVTGDVRVFRDAERIGGVADRTPIAPAFLAARMVPFAGFSGGLSVASGDTDGDGNDELFVSKNSGPSVVAVFSGAGPAGTFAPAAVGTFEAFAGFLGEVRLGSADVNGDGTAEVLTTTGFSGDARGTPVKAFTRTGTGFGLVRSFYANPGYLPGAWLTSKDFAVAPPTAVPAPTPTPTPTPTATGGGTGSQPTNPTNNPSSPTGGGGTTGGGTTGGGGTTTGGGGGTTGGGGGTTTDPGSGGTGSTPSNPSSPGVTDVRTAAGVSVAFGTTNQSRLVLEGTAAANAAVAVRIDGSVVGSAVANAAGSWTFETAALDDGMHVFTVDDGGNAGVSTVIDTKAPVVTLRDPRTFAGILEVIGRVGGEGAGSFPATYDVDLNKDGHFAGANELGYAVGSISDQTTTISLPPLGGGNWKLRARVTDRAGNEGISNTVLLRNPLEYRIDPNAYFPPNQLVPVGGGGVNGGGFGGGGNVGALGSPGSGATSPSGPGGGKSLPSTIGESEPNDDTTNFNDLTVGPGDPGVATGAVSSGSDVDTFRFTLAARTALFIDVNSRRTGLSTTLDSVVTLLDSGGNQLDQNDNGYNFDTGLPAQAVEADSTTADSSLYREVNAGTYFVQVSSNSNTTGNYELRIRADTNFSSTVPQFSSNPGAPNTVYLDFDGHSSTTDDWATSNGNYTADAFDMAFNGNDAEWSPGEAEMIRQIVRVVGEDYAPFDINFTTIDPGAAETDGVSLRMIMTNSDPSIAGGGSGVLGVAFLSSFNNGSDTDNVAWGAFNGEFGGFNSFSGGTSGDVEAVAVAIGDTVSHEFGHTMGLEHYSNEPNLIMNDTAGGLSRKLWANQADVNGNNQDDMQVIASIDASNSTAYRADDAGNSIGAATPLPPIATGYQFAGVISVLDTASPAGNDVDFFSFLASGTGTTTITAGVDEYLNDLNATLQVFDAAGTLVGSDDPAGSFDATVTLTLVDGALYFVSVGTAGGAGEAGGYILTVSTPAPPPGAPPGGPGGGGPTLPPLNLDGDRFEENDTSDRATFLGPQNTISITNLTIGAKAGLPDYDWFVFVAANTATYNFGITTGTTNGPLELHVFVENNGSLTEVSTGTTGTTASFSAGDTVYVEIKGSSLMGGITEGEYDLSVTFT